MNQNTYFEQAVPRDVIDRFIEEFVFDYDAVKACQRLGYTLDEAMHHAKIFLNDPVTHACLRDAMEGPQINEGLPNKIIAMLMREANDYGANATGAARVSALRLLSVIMGMDDLPRKQKESDTKTIDGQVLVAPAIADIDAWEDTAVAVQSSLLDKVENQTDD